MLIVNGLDLNRIISWDSVESLSIDESESPNVNLRIAMKSGCFVSVLNPTVYGEDLTLSMAIDAWINCYTCWEVSENDSKLAPIVAPNMVQRHII